MNYIKQLYITLIFGGLFLGLQAQDQPEKVLILGGIAHIGNGDKMEDVAISLKNGYIEFIKYQMGSRIDRSDYDTVIQLDKEKHIYPGFIAPNTILGLTEIDAVRATRDYNDVGEYNPNVRALIAFNPESKIIQTARFNGVLMEQATPRGGVISGTSSIMKLNGWNWEDAVHTPDDGIHLNWPSQFVGGGWWADPKPLKENKQADERIQQIYAFMEEARAYAGNDNEEINLKLEAMKGIFDGTQTLFVHTDRAKEITQAVNMKRQFNIKKMVIVGGYDAYLVPEILKDNKVAVIYRRPHELPVRPEDPVDLPYRIPSILQDTGVLFCLDMSGDMEAMNQRNLPFVAGTAVAYGMDYEQAVAAITGNTAQILGISDKTGTLENGKEATLFISNGDALDMRTNNVVVAYIQGFSVDLSNFQKDLYLKYKAKYE